MEPNGFVPDDLVGTINPSKLVQIPQSAVNSHSSILSPTSPEGHPQLAQASTIAPLPNEHISFIEASTSSVSGPVPSFQDLTDSSDGDDDSDDDERDWDDLVLKVKEAFSHDQIQEMMHYLKERGIFAFMKRFVDIERVPIHKLLLAFGVLVPDEPNQLGTQLQMLKVACSRVLRNRDKLDEYNTVSDAISLISSSSKIMVLTGAGVSTSCGIPDFRSPTGLYARLKEENWELDDPQQMFDLDFFKEKPNVFYSFAKEIYPSNFTPSPCHCFVKSLENNGKLLRNYTQNIDGLFEKVGVEKILNCHGSFATASCLRCRTKFPGSAIESDVFAQKVPLCPLCSKEDEEIAVAKAAALELGKKDKGKGKKKEGWNEDSTSDEEDDKGEWEGKPLVKPDIVFFGEMLSDEFDRRLLEDRENVDLLIVIGTSLRVSPVAQIVSHLPHSIPQILINRDPVTHANFDIHLLGDGDTIVKYLSERLGDGFELSKVLPGEKAEEEKEGEGEKEEVVPEQVGDSHVWLFPGANREHAWVKAVRNAFGGEESESSPGGDDEDDGEREGGESQGSDRSDVKEGKGKAESEDDAEKEMDNLRVPLAESGAPSRSRTRSPEQEKDEETESKKIRIE